MNKETGGVVLAFGGFVFLVGAFKGTWRNALHGLAPDVFKASDGTTTATGQRTSGNVGVGASVAPAGSRLPGTSVAPAGGRVPLGQ